MPRVHHVKKARKANKDRGIKKGDSYYWWKFRYGGKRVSKTYPKRSQLTQSGFYASLYDAEDSLTVGDDLEDLASAMEAAAEEVRSLGEEASSNKDSMENAFPSGCPTMELLEERADRCEELASELESAAEEVRGIAEESSDETEGEEEKTELTDDQRQRAEDILGSIDWGIE